MIEDRDRFGPFTPREKQIVLLVAEGKTARQIARILGTTAPIVQHKLNNVRSRLGVKNNAHLVALALRAGLIGPEEMPP